MSSDSTRVFGLDVMRALAIVMVVFWHSYDLIRELAPGFEMPFFLDGVDLFFVLSGYLIGGLLLKLQQRDDLGWWQRLLGFWRRRFFRTLPNYYLFLCINIALLWAGVTEGLLNQNVLAYFAFLQNLWKPFSLFFWESWSLVIEVWFYLLFPVMLFAFTGVLRMRTSWAFALTIAIFLLGPLLVRFQFLPEADPMPVLDSPVRALVITRVDTIVYGLLAALLQLHWARWWRELRWPLFVIGMAGILVVPVLYGQEHRTYSITWYYSLNAFAMALLLPLMSTWVKEPRGGSFVTLLSRLSYAIFFVHLPVRALLLSYYEPSDPFIGGLQLLFYCVLCIALAWPIYRYYEKPMMEIRERFKRR